MKLLVTGLCLSRNLGGPAMALTLLSELRKRFPDAHFTFAIDPASYDQEKQWAEYYNLNIVRRDNVIAYLYLTYLFRMAIIIYRVLKRKKPYVTSLKNSIQIHNEYMNAYRECDAVINMRGISYVGDGVRGTSEGLSSYLNLYYANKWKKPFTHFIQSFGPFNDWKVRYFAKRDFNQVDFVPARGKESSKYCRSIIKRPEKVYDFPDIAILLQPAGEEWTNRYLAGLGLSFGTYTILSPSAVIYNLPGHIGGSVGKEHLRTFYLIAEKIMSKNERVLFLPHMYSDNKKDCDREICFRVLQMLKDKGHDISFASVVVDDIDVWQAKALIANSKQAIVSRYHALVAAISTGVPVITIGWNIKYYDLMSYYGIESMAIDTRKNNPEDICKQVFNMLTEYEHNQYKDRMKKMQPENEQKVREAFDLLERWIMAHVENRG